jgi:DNA replication protein DnaC
MGSTCDREAPKPGELEKYKADCYNRSEGQLNAQDGYNCDKCHNKGVTVRAYQDDIGAWKLIYTDCECAEVRRTIKRMKASGLKDIIRDYTFAKYQAIDPWQKQIKDAAMAYAKEPNGWFFVGGQSGSGKTHICTAICREFLLAGMPVQYMLWRDDVVKLKAAITEPESYKALIARYKDTKVLYIDDLFKTGKSQEGAPQRPTGADVNVAFEIINYRYNNPELLTVISSECTVNELLEIDEAVAGRIVERAKAFSLGPDRKKNWRLKGATEL